MHVCRELRTRKALRKKGGQIFRAQKHEFKMYWISSDVNNRQVIMHEQNES